MPAAFFMKRTHTEDPDFISLIRQLDHELWNELQEDQATYDPFNNVAGMPNAIVLYDNDIPVASGCLKKISTDRAEVKRMFVQKAYRGRGLSKKILKELETWATEMNFRELVLETSVHFNTAKQLYLGAGFTIIPNYPPYVGLEDSVCMKKNMD
ncbi:MAG: GNAT family N-acetyltransferase [Chitinophagaceae bacterium]|nr:GNAT family N-acetyltransferase [Chitinophagaceae bacterium]